MTRREHELMAFIVRFIKKNGIPPTYAEMADGLGIVSRGNTHRMVRRLCAQGFLKIMPEKFRTVRVTKKWAP